MEIDKIPINFFCLKKQLKEHKEIKKDLIKKINKTPSGQDVDSWTKIDKVDWFDCENFEREWVIFLKPYLQKLFIEFANEINVTECNIKKIWFQEYHKDGEHSWHVHDSNYTGVYYLNHDSSVQNTNYYDQYNDEIKSFNVKEGDVVIFPSFLLHKALPNTSSKKRLIVSFNLDFDGISNQFIKKWVD